MVGIRGTNFFMTKHWVTAACALLVLTACEDDVVKRVIPDGGTAMGSGDAAQVDGRTETTDTLAMLDGAILDGAMPDAAATISPGALPVRGYLRASDSPFSGVDFSYFHLEDFEDGLLNTPGVSDSGQGRQSSTFRGDLIDSVDGDDGNPSDNKCKKAVGNCDARFGDGSLKFTFDPNVLGGLPTHAGAVWTDGEGLVGFEAFGPDGKVVYEVKPFSQPGFPDSTVNSSTAEDRFFGAYFPGGISAIRIFNTQGGIEVDHLQYGRVR